MVGEVRSVLYDSSEPVNIPEFIAYTPPGPPPPPFIGLQSISRFDAVDSYRVVRDDMPALLFGYTLAGRGRLTYKGRILPLEPGSAFLIDCREWHRYETDGRHWDFLWMHLDGELAFAYHRQIEGARGPVVAGTPAFAECWREVAELARKNDALLQPLLSAAIYRLLSLFFLPPPRDERIERVLSLIRTRVDEPMTVDSLAREACMSSYYFQRRFRQETGQTVHQYLCHQRVARAKQLLVTTDLPVAIVAERTGFSGSSHLSAVFKAVTGRTPGEYRKSP